MKSNTIIALLLTFFMLLLVLSAAVVFLYQDRGQLLREVDQLHLDATVIAVQAQQTVSDMAVQNASVAAAATASHNDLVAARATQDALSARVATLEAVEPVPTATPAPPFVAIVSPEEGASLPAGEAVDVVAFAAYPAGIDGVELLLDDEPQDLVPSDGPYRVIAPEEPLILDPGTYTITVTMTGADNFSSSDAVTFTVLPPPEEEEEEEASEGSEQGDDGP